MALLLQRVAKESYIIVSANCATRDPGPSPKIWLAKNIKYTRREQLSASALQMRISQHCNGLFGRSAWGCGRSSGASSGPVCEGRCRGKALAREQPDETFGTINVCRICLIDDSHAITHVRQRGGGREGEREREGQSRKEHSIYVAV